jgi:hypothetical protein
MAALVITSNASAIFPRQGATVANRTVKSRAIVKESTNLCTLPMESRSIAEVNAEERKKQATQPAAFSPDQRLSIFAWFGSKVSMIFSEQP